MQGSDYIQIKFQNLDSAKQEILIALLANEGYDGFEQSDQILTAFIDQPSFNQTNLDRICKEQETEYAVSLIPSTNWNQSWESNFSPVIIDDFAAIRAHFHEPVKGVRHEIIITPKMSFGTGHHATTYMMIKEMSSIDFKEKTVMDFGTGTGVLAILAEKMGASEILAIDYDDWSIANATENLQLNACENIKIMKHDSANVPGAYGIIIANINRNVILDNLQLLADRTAKNGILLVSGLLEEDRKGVIEKAESVGFKLVSFMSRNNWNLLRFIH